MAKASSGLKPSSDARTRRIVGRRHALVFEHPCCAGFRSVARLPVFRGDLPSEPGPVLVRLRRAYAGLHPLCIHLFCVHRIIVDWHSTQCPLARISLLLMLIEFAVARLVIDTALLRSPSAVLVGLAAAPFVKQGIEEIGDRL